MRGCSGVTRPAGQEKRVFTMADLDGVRTIRANSALPGFRVSEQSVLARDRIRFVGEPIAACVAASRAAAEDLVAAYWNPACRSSISAPGLAAIRSRSPPPMDNHGQIYAADTDGRLRLAPIFDRLARSGARNVQVRSPRGPEDVLADLEGRGHLVMIDAPCTGSGAWRRNPDAKWRIRPGALEQRIKDQDETLQRAQKFVKKGGRIVYVRPVRSCGRRTRTGSPPFSPAATTFCRSTPKPRRAAPA